MVDNYGSSIPLWAQRLLTTLQAECITLEPRIAETKASTATKLVAFKSLKDRKEKEQEQAILTETVRVNNEIMRRRDEATTDSGQFKATIEAKIEETRHLESVLHSKSSQLPKMTETLLKLQSELDALRKQEEQLNAEFKRAKTAATEKAKRATFSDPLWADLDLLEPVFRTPEVPKPKWTAQRTDSAARKDVLARPISSLEPRAIVGLSEASPGSSSSSPGSHKLGMEQRYTRAGRSEVMRMLLSDRSQAIVESIMLPQRHTLQALIEILQKEDPVYPIDHSLKLLIARGLQNLHTFYGKDVELIEWLVKFDVSRANEANQVFAEGTITHYILSTFALRYGSTYLKDTIRDTIYRILKDDKPYEMNPDKVVKNVEWVDINIKAVKSLAYDILIEIAGSSFKLPVQLRRIAALLRAEMVRKFPQDGFNMVARFLFDALFCRAIERPEDCNIEIKEVSDKMRPLLRILASTMSRVARNDPYTDDISLPMNEFISNYLGTARKFLTESLKEPDREVWATLTPYSFPACIYDIQESLKKISLAHLDSIAKRIAELDGHRLYSYTTIYYLHERLKILQDFTLGETMAHIEKNHPFVDELFDLLFEEDGSLIDSIAAVATPKANFEPEPIASAIIACSLYKDPTGAHAEFLVRTVLRKEMSAFSNSSTSSQSLSRLLNGFGAAMYASFARVLGAELLQELMPPLVENIRKGKCGKLDKKGCMVLGQFVETVAHALPKAPSSLWKLASFLTRQLMDPGPALFLVKFIGHALENPAKYLPKMPEGKDKDTLTKRIASVRLFLLRVSTMESLVKVESKHYAEANPIIKEVHDSWISANDGWAPKEASSHASVVPTISYSWEEVRACIKLWMVFVDSDSSFELLLSKQLRANLAFTLGDFFFAWALPVGPRTSTIVTTTAAS